MAIRFLTSQNIQAGTLTVSTITNLTTASNTFLVSDGGLVRFRTAAQVRSDIGAGTGNGTVTSVAVTNGTGISASVANATTTPNITITNTDRGSSQNIFKNFAVSGQSTVVADSNDDTLTLVAGSNVTITTNATTDTITIASSYVDTNNYPTSLGWDTGTGILTLGRNGLSSLTVDLDGRYPENNGSGATGTWGISITGNATTATTLQTTRSISLGTAVTSTATNFNGSANIIIPVTGVSEAYLNWGGRNFSGNYGPIDAALMPDLGANRLAFTAASAVTIEYSQDGGTTWVNYGASDATKINLLNGNSATIQVGGGSYPLGTDYTNYRVRVTINTAGQIYTTLNKFIILVSTNGSSGSFCTIDARTQSNYLNGIDTWNTFSNQTPVAGWSGYNVINTSGLTTFGNTPASQFGQVRFTFGQTGFSTAYSGLQIIKLLGFGGVGWQTPSTLAATGQIYTYNHLQAVFFPNAVSAVTFNGTLNGTATNITATSNTTLTSLTNLNTVGNITTGTWNGSTISVARGGTGAVTHTSGNVLIGAGTSAITSLSRSGIDTRTSFPPSQHAMSSHSATAWRMFFSNATTTAIQELAFGTAGQYLRSGGATANPTWSTINYSEISNPPTIGNGTLSLGVSGVGLSGTSTFTANQSGGSTFTVTSNATSANTANTIVSRDGSGNFSAGTITAAQYNIASNGMGIGSDFLNNITLFGLGATKFNFDLGSSGNALIGTNLSSIVFTNNISASNLSGTNTGDQTTISGNAATATTLQTARNINGTSFNGSVDITTANWGTARTINGTSINGSTNYTTANWGTARTITIGNTGKSVNGSANVAWTLAEIGAQAALTNPVTGTGTTNFLSKFTGASTLGNSLVFDNGTNVGIGTTSPQAKLDILGGIAQDVTGLILRNNAWACNQSLSIDFWNGNNKSTYPASRIVSNMDGCSSGGERLSFYTQPAGGDQLISLERLTIRSSGNVGIGTTTPQVDLEIASKDATSTVARIRLTNKDISVIDEQDLSEIQFYNSDADGAHISAYIKNIAAETFGRKGQLAFGVSTTNSTNAVEALRIDENGNIGIGISNPAEKLDVSGNVFMGGGGSRTLTLEASGAGGTEIRLRPNTTGGFARINVGNTNQPLDFQINSSDVMRIAQTGNILIGTTTENPSGDKLQVQGVIRGIFPGDPGAGSITAKFLSFAASPYGMIFSAYATGAHAIQVKREATADTFNLSLQPSGGNLGVGTLTPTTKLDVNGVISLRSALHMTAGGGSGVPDWYFQINGSGDLVLDDVGTRNFIFANAGPGQVLIGTTVAGTPTYGSVPQFVTAASTGGVIDIRSLNTDIVANSLLGRIQFTGKDDGTVGYTSAAIEAISAGTAGSGSNGGGILKFMTSSNGYGTNPTTHMWISHLGYVTIGSTNSNSYPLRVLTQVSNISIYADFDIVAYSDQSVKENIRPIENVIERVKKSRGVLYDRIDSGSKDNIGFIAQELEVAFPELVTTNEDGTKAVKYQNAVAVMFEAIKEQQKQIDELKELVNKLIK